MSRYAIWNKKDPILTPVGEVLTAEQWIERHPVAEIPSVVIVCANQEINGAYYNTLGNMMARCEAEGCDFSACVTPEDKLNAIEAFEDERNARAREAAEREAANAEMNAMSMASIAAQLEYQNMMTFDDVEEA